MKKRINLEMYLRMGGKLENVDWSKAISTFYDENLRVKIVSFEDKGEASSSNAKLINFTFENGKTKRYAIVWIDIEVDLVLADKYL